MRFLWCCCFCLLLSGGAMAINVAAVLSTSSKVGKEQVTAMQLAVGRFGPSSSIRFLYVASPANDPLAAASAVENFTSASWRAEAVVLGSETWPEATLVAAAMGSTLQAAPIVSFPTVPSLAPATAWPNVLRMADYDTLRMRCIAAFLATYHWRRVIVIYEEDAVGSFAGTLQLLSGELRGRGLEIERYKAFPLHGSLVQPRAAIRRGLAELGGQVFKVFVVARASAPFAADLFVEATELGMMGRGHVWITSDIPFDSLDASFLSSYMEGVVGINAYFDKESSIYQDFRSRFRKKYRTLFPDQSGNADPGFVTLRLYDTVSAIAGVAAGGKMRVDDAILRGFDGLSGEVRFRGRELSSDGAVVELVNVVGRSCRRIGFWAERLGFHKGAAGGSRRVETLDSVFWPGGPSKVPGGWRTMTVGVPTNGSFHQFVKVELGKNQSIGSVTGFSIEVFEEAVRRLPYELLFHYSPHHGRYDGLVHQVYSGNLDAAVGDITIVASRSKFVDFTEPYIESSLAMIVPLRQSPDAWDFMKPFTKKMWIMIVAAFTYTGTVVWFLEHRTNPEFKGPWQNKLAMGIWFSFSTFFSTHGQVNSNFTRIVIAVWLFVVLVLTSSYTASLSSILTIESLEPKIGDIKNLGVDRALFVADHIRDVFGPFGGKMGLDHKAIDLQNETDLEDLRQGKITAAIFETPYIRAFLAGHGDIFTVSAGDIVRLRGFGFVFPKGSPLVTDISQSILSMNDDGTLKRLEEKWISFDLVRCPRPKQDKTRGSLDLQSFWVLFVTTGGTSTVVLLLFLSRLIIKGKYRTWFRGKLLSEREETNSQLQCTALGSPPVTQHVIEDFTPEPTHTTNALENSNPGPEVIHHEEKAKLLLLFLQLLRTFLHRRDVMQ